MVWDPDEIVVRRGTNGHGRGSEPGGGGGRSNGPGGPRDPISVVVAVEADSAAWDSFVSHQPAATGYHAWAWRTVFERSFGHECVYLAARQNGQVMGVLPLVHIRSRLFGRTMTSLPFVNYGGVLADSTAVAHALVDAAAHAAKVRGCRHVELRHTDRRFSRLPSKQHKVSMQLPLEAEIWNRLDRKVRNQIRKAEKSGLTVDLGGSELLGDFYKVFARNMRDLGTPVYARRFFDEVLRAFPDRARVLVVRLKDKPVAAGLTYRTGSTIEVPWASSVREFNSLCPNHLLYWRAIESAVAEGCDLFDFGRSTPNEGTYRFKEQWGALPVKLHWEYCLLRTGGLPDQSPKNPKYRLMIAAWKRCPLWLANAIGPRLVRSIP